MVKKKYSINWDDDTAVSFEVNGVEYKSLDDIPNEDDRLKLETMMDSAEDAEFDAEFAKMGKDVPQADETPIENIILPIFTGVAVLMLLIAGIASFGNIAKINREETAPGRVTDMTKQLEYDEEDRDRVISEAYFPVVEFVALDGKRRNVQLDEGSFPAAYEVGDEVTILYEPDHPVDARIQSFGSSVGMWILPGITGILGIAFLGAVLVVRRVMFNSEEAASPTIQSI